MRPWLLWILLSTTLEAAFVHAADLDAPTYGQLIADLDSDTYGIRIRARSDLISYANPSSAVRLTAPQLQDLRSRAKSDASLEVRRHARRVVDEWVQLNPLTVAPRADVLKGIQFKFVDYDAFLNEGHFMLGPFKVAHATAVGFGFADKMVKHFEDVQSELDGPFTDQVVPRLTAMRQTVANLTPADLQFILFSKGNAAATKDDVVGELDKAITAAADLMQKINATLGDPAPGPAEKVRVNQTGMIDTGKSFRVTLNGINVTPGDLTMLAQPPGQAIADPPGRVIVGEPVILRADDSLVVHDGSIHVLIEYGNPELVGLESIAVSSYELVHFANGSFSPMDGVVNDQGAFTLSGSYQAPSPSLDIDQFGQFAVVRPATPVPNLHGGGLVLLSLCLGIVGVVAVQRQSPQAPGKDVRSQEILAADSRHRHS